MKRPLLGIACACVLLVAGCSAPATSPQTTADSTAPAASAAAQATTPAALVAGAAVDKDALAAEMNAAAKALTSVRMEMTTTFDADGTSVDVGIVGDMDISDPEAPRGTMTITGPLAMDLVMDGADAYYLRMALLGDTWYSISPDDLEGGVPDPADQTTRYEEFLDDATAVTYVGEETVDGEATRHYTLMVPASDVTEDGSGGDTVVPVDMYVNERGWLKKLRAELTEPAAVATEILMSRFNEPVTINVPSGAQPFPKS